MKNHKGTVAAFLTLGLVVIGSLITLGSSLFINNNKTNLASNSRADYTNPCVPIKCPDGTYSNWKKGTGFYETDECLGVSTGYCVGHLSSAPADTPIPGGGGTSGNACKSNNGYCIDYQDCSLKVSNTAANTYCSGINSRDVCCKNSSSAPTRPPSSGSSGGTGINNGTIEPGENCCFRKYGKIYVYASYESMEASDMLDNGGVGDCSRQSETIARSYSPVDGPAFDCDGSIQNQTEEDTIDQSLLDGSSSEVPDGCIEGPADGKSCVVIPHYSNTYTDENGNKWCCHDNADIIPTTKPICDYHIGFTCPNDKNKKFNYYKSTVPQCAAALQGNCYGTSSTSCLTQWSTFIESGFVKKQCVEGVTPAMTTPAAGSNTGTDEICQRSHSDSYCNDQIMYRSCKSGYSIDTSRECKPQTLYSSQKYCCYKSTGTENPPPPPPPPSGLSTFPSDCLSEQVSLGNGSCQINCSGVIHAIECN